MSELERCSDLDDAETRWIAQLKCTRILYNSTTGGRRGSRPSEAVKRRVSASLKARLQDPAIRELMSRITKALWTDPDFRRSATERARLQLADLTQRLRLSQAAAAWRAAHPESAHALSIFNQTSEARAAKSRSRRLYFQNHPGANRRFSEAQLRPKALFVLEALGSGEEKLAADIASERYLTRQVTEGLNRYAKLGLVRSRALRKDERPEITGRHRRARVWQLC